MIYRTPGSTVEKVSKIGVGGWHLWKRTCKFTRHSLRLRL
jgi:hypothetical protein